MRPSFDIKDRVDEKLLSSVSLCSSPLSEKISNTPLETVPDLCSLLLFFLCDGSSIVGVVAEYRLFVHVSSAAAHCSTVLALAVAVYLLSLESRLMVAVRLRFLCAGGVRRSWSLAGFVGLEGLSRAIVVLSCLLVRCGCCCCWCGTSKGSSFAPPTPAGQDVRCQTAPAGMLGLGVCGVCGLADVGVVYLRMSWCWIYLCR